jgi:hypothetical protein
MNLDNRGRLDIGFKTMSNDWIVEVIEQLERAVGVHPRVEKFAASNGETYDVARVALFSGSAAAINLNALRKNMPKGTLLYYGNVIYPDVELDQTGLVPDIRFDLTAIGADDPSIILEFEGTQARSRGWDSQRLARELCELETQHQLSFEIFHAAKLSFSAEVSFIPKAKPPTTSFENPHVYHPSASIQQSLLGSERPASTRNESERPPESLGVDEPSGSEPEQYAFNQDVHEHEECEDEHCSLDLSAEQEAASETAAEKLLEFCPELFWGKGMRMNVKSLAANIRGLPMTLNFVWPERSEESTEDIEVHTADRQIS